MHLESIIGTAWIFGDNVDTDSIYPGRYLHILDNKQIPRHAFEFVKPEFADKVEPGDIIIGGKNFGCGSSREHAVLALKNSGIGAICAVSYGRIFYRNAINNALPVLNFDIEENDIVLLYSTIFNGDELEVDFSNSRLEKISSGERFDLKPLPRHLLEIIENDGLIEHLRKQFRKDGN